MVTRLLLVLVLVMAIVTGSPARSETNLLTNTVIQAVPSRRAGPTAPHDAPGRDYATRFPLYGKWKIVKHPGSQDELGEAVWFIQELGISFFVNGELASNMVATYQYDERSIPNRLRVVRLRQFPSGRLFGVVLNAITQRDGNRLHILQDRGEGLPQSFPETNSPHMMILERVDDIAP